MGSMATALVKPEKGRPKLDRLTVAERVFCAEFLANGQVAKDAAMVAYPKNQNPVSASGIILKRPRVAKYLGQMLQTRIDTSGISVDRILQLIERSLFFNPLDHFIPTGQGGWIIQDPDKIPKEIGQLVKGVKCKTRFYDDHDESEITLTFVDKDAARRDAMKYLGMLDADFIQNNFIQNNNGGQPAFDLDQLCEPYADEEDDVIEGRIAGVLEQAGDSE